MKVTRRLVKVFFIAPFNIMIVIPGMILWFSRQTGFLTSFDWGFDLLLGILGVVLIIFGIIITWSCVSLFVEFGDGTPAPWDPPKHLVVSGLYRHVRNPLVEGVFCILLGESLLFGSLLLLLWFFLFVSINLAYTPLIEEPELLSRFGEPFRSYMRNVPRWLPRKPPWKSQP
jgi:protein-S-isoprenylcysteine O-methyltransferase Ste14